jgi:ABC-2 type transport system permease protein
MGAIYILWLRELKRYVRSRVQIVVSLGQPCLYLLALGFGLGPVFRQAGHGSYLQFMAPGVVGMTVLFSSVFSGIAMLWIGNSASSRKPWSLPYRACKS